jgi:hypothetical protein
VFLVNRIRTLVSNVSKRIRNHVLQSHVQRLGLFSIYEEHMPTQRNDSRQFSATLDRKRRKENFDIINRTNLEIKWSYWLFIVWRLAHDYWWITKGGILTVQRTFASGITILTFLGGKLTKVQQNDKLIIEKSVNLF